MSTPFALAALVALALATPLAARAADLQVIAGGGIAGALNELVKQYEVSSGTKITVRYGTTPELIKMATSGDAFDLTVVPGEFFRDEAARARTIAGRIETVARVGLGVAVRAGAPKPDIASEAAFKQALIKAPSIATIPASAAGALVLKLFERLGIAEDMKPKTKALPGPGPLVQALAAGEAELGVFLINVLTAPGLDLVGPVPAALDQQVVYTCAVAAAAKQPEAAQAFIAFLRSPAAQKVIQAKGLTPG
jgi:molybdate transport system substrate-binding protein